uniref:Uncharacterized protein n=1 Tax=Cacopsylla melanoneura TaxID=428564 RepID=A0A8D8M4R8_9HEMI
MNKDLKPILKVKSCLPHSEKASCSKQHVLSTCITSEENPDIRTALRIANEIIETASLDVYKAAKNLTSASEESKSFRNVNIPFDETIYRDLVDLSIHDEQLNNLKQTSKPKKSIPAKPKDRTPCIHDYRVSQYSVPHVFQAKSEPPPRQMIRKYNGKEMYELYEKIRGSNL